MFVIDDTGRTGKATFSATMVHIIWEDDEYQVPVTYAAPEVILLGIRELRAN